jgi:hypothetical protein
LFAGKSGLSKIIFIFAAAHFPFILPGKVDTFRDILPAIIFVSFRKFAPTSENILIFFRIWPKSNINGIIALIHRKSKGNFAAEDYDVTHRTNLE